MSSKKEIFFTGSTGIAGCLAVNELIQRGYSLKLMVRDIPPQNKNIFLDYVQGDLSQIDNLKKISQSNIGIIHYACASLRGRSEPEVDIEAMKILLKNWGEGPFTFISTLDVYGIPKDVEMIDESLVLSGRMNSYAAGKIACEELLVQAAQKRGRNDYTIFRAPWIFAPNLRSKAHILDRFLKGFEKEILLPGITQAEWEKNIDFWIDAQS